MPEYHNGVNQCVFHTCTEGKVATHWDDGQPNKAEDDISPIFTANTLYK